jgi:predicted enzyme related to lactoylglutathione lyase
VPVLQAFAGIPVRDYGALLGWYERLFGRPADFHPHDTEAVWQTSDSGWVYVVRDPARAGNALVTLIVDDLDERLAGLADRGVVAGPVEPVGPNMRKADVTDPEGNRISFAQEIGGG